MVATSEPDGGEASRRLTAIMFTDLVGYSALAHRDEPLALQLLELHRAWIREILPAHRGREVETIGDAFLVEFPGALAAVECAVAIQRRFTGHNATAGADRRMQLRIGIHAGDVEHKDGKVMGDVVNIASRIHGMAEPGGICVSDDVHRAVRTRRGFHFEGLGMPALKNIAAPPALHRVMLDPVAPWRLAWTRWRRRARFAGAVALVVVAAALAAKFIVWDGGNGTTEASVAVLPFTNMSADPDNEYFTDGMHDTILTHLSRVHALRVISRTSVMQFRGGARDVSEIARALGVDHVVEGSVQRSGHRLRITVQLIEAGTDRHLWAENYDRDVADIFAVQSDVAARITAALRANLAAEERERIERIPSRNAEAYDLYLRALLVKRATAFVERRQVEEAIGWLERAVGLDPEFALAYALLAQMQDALYWNMDERTSARLDAVRGAAETALKLDPGLADAHIARALYLYHGRRELGAALDQLEVARGLEPGNADVHYWLAQIYRRQDRWTDAVATIERAIVLDPLNVSMLNSYATTLLLMRRYAEITTVYERMARVDPHNPLAGPTLAFGAFLQDGDVGRVSRALAAVGDAADPECTLSYWRTDWLLMERRFSEAAVQARVCPRMVDYDRARLAWLASGRRDTTLARRARAGLEQRLAERPDDATARARLAFVLAMLRDAPAALAEAERALAAMPLSQDAVEGASVLGLVAEVHANAGAEDRAVDELDQLLQVPSEIHARELNLHPAWDPLRDDPRFQKLIADHLPKAGG